MANLIQTVPTITTESNELFLKPLINDPLVTQLPFTFVFGNMPRSHFYNTNVDKIMKAITTCAPVFGGSAEISKKVLTPIEVQANVEQCYDTFFNKFWGGKLPAGVQIGELTPEITDFMQTQQNYAFNRDLLSLLFLGDENVSESDAYYSLMDGIYTKLKAGAGATDGTVDVGSIVASDLDATNFFATMNAIYLAQSRLLRGVPKANKRWIWTEAVYDLYTTYLETSTQGTAGIKQTEYVVNGVDALTFKGIPIVVVPIVDERLETDFTDNSGLPVNPYRVILTAPSEHTVYLDQSSFLNNRLWYSNDDNVVRLTGRATMAYEYGYGELNVIAGF
jgi:hypothetical protein